MNMLSKGLPTNKLKTGVRLIVRLLILAWPSSFG